MLIQYDADKLFLGLAYDQYTTAVPEKQRKAWEAARTKMQPCNPNECNMGIEIHGNNGSGALLPKWQGYKERLMREHRG